MNQKLYTLTNEHNQEYQTTERGTVYGCKSTKIYGCRNCPAPKHAIGMGTYKGVFFKDELTAIKAGYRPCGTCLKAKFNIWKARKDDRHTLADHQDYLSLPFPIDPVDL